MEDTELARLERRMEHRWSDVAFAEIGQVSLPEIERRYDRYLEAMEAYMLARQKVKRQAKQQQDTHEQSA